MRVEIHLCLYDSGSWLNKLPFCITLVRRILVQESFMKSHSPRPWRLDENNLAMVRKNSFEVAILPFGATEPHNLHLPYGTDCYEAEWIADTIAQEANQQGAKCVVLPTIPYGTETNMQEFPLAMNLQPTTLLAMLRDLVASLTKSGISKVVLLNSHGGNDFKPFLRELHGTTSAHLFLCNWFQMVRDVSSKIFEHPDDHAGEMETSMILAYRPELVARNSDGSLTADEGKARPMRMAALQQGWVSITRPWHLLTTQSGCGNPHAATSDKAHQLMEVVRARLVPFLVELSQSPLDPHFPFET